MQRLLEILQNPQVIKILRVEAVVLIALGVILNLSAPQRLATAANPSEPVPPTPETPVEVVVVEKEEPATGPGSRPIVVRDRDRNTILHHYQQSTALLVGQAGREGEIDQVGQLLGARGFDVKKLIAPDLATLKGEIDRLVVRQGVQLGSRRVLLYLSGETSDASGRNEIFLRTSDTPPGEVSARQLRATAFPLDSLRYLADDLKGSPLVVAINSGFDARFLEKTGRQPAFLTVGDFVEPTPFFIVAGPAGGLPEDDFPDAFIRAFDGRADTDNDRQVSTLELARSIGGSAYLATVSGTPASGPGMVFDLPADAVVKNSGANPAVAGRGLAVEEVIPESPVPEATPAALIRLPEPGEKPQSGESFHNILGMRMLWQPKSQFQLRPPSSARVPPPPVAVDVEGFWLAQSEVSERQYRELIGSAGAGDEQRPMTNVSWAEAVAFCEEFTASERASGRLPEGFIYRLPTEHEWEYASRPDGERHRKANRNTLTSWVARLGQLELESEQATGADAGVLNLSSGAMEWCLDRYVASAGEAGSPAPSPEARVVRGGIIDGPMMRLSTRFGVFPETGKQPFIGFRLALGRESVQASTVASLSTAPPGDPFTLTELFEDSPYADWGSYNHSLILKKAQKQFKDMELYTSSVDGAAGSGTQAAINAYQAANALTNSGRLDEATLTRLELAAEVKQKAPVAKPRGPWWVTRPNNPRRGDREPPESIYSGFRGKARLASDRTRKQLNTSEYRKYQIYEAWQDVN